MMGQLSKAKTLFKEILIERPLLLRALHVWFLIRYSCLLNFFSYKIVAVCAEK
jgi:hypothetical protein